MNHSWKNPMPAILAAVAAGGLASCATATPQVRPDAKTDAALNAMSSRLEAAKTVRVHAERVASTGFTVGMPMAEKSSGDLVIHRPDKLSARVKTNHGSRSIALAAGSLTVVDHSAKTHSTVKSPTNIDDAVRSVQSIYGVTPPSAELLVNHPRTFLLEGVKSVTHSGMERIAGTECDKLNFEQDGFAWSLWISTADSLPRRMTLTYPNGEGGPPLVMTTSFSQWQLDSPVSDSELSVGIPKGSRAIEMIPLVP